LGGILAVAVGVLYGRVGSLRAQPLTLLLAAGGFVTLVLVPQLKYPANPPAVGAEDTIGLRTALYFEMMLIALAALVLAVLLVRLLWSRVGPGGAIITGAVAFLALVVAMQLALPGGAEAPPDFPTDVLWRFRLGSFATQLVLWVALGTIFGRLARSTLRA
jgi:hypothetical protein